MRTPVLTWILCVLALIGLFAWMGTRVVPVTAPAKSDGQVLVGGPFTLVDGNGKVFTEKDLLGHYSIVYFGFTHCPDICPTSLLLIENALHDLGPLGSKVMPVFITLDPERDTPEVVGDYVEHFGPRMVGLTGSAEQIKIAADAYKVYYAKVEDANSALGYMIDHSGFIYLMGPDGNYITHFPHTISEQALADGIRQKVN